MAVRRVVLLFYLLSIVPNMVAFLIPTSSRPSVNIGGGYPSMLAGLNRLKLPNAFLRPLRRLQARTVYVEYDNESGKLVECKEEDEKKPKFTELDFEYYESDEGEYEQNYDLTQKISEHMWKHNSVNENRKNLAYSSQRVALLIFLRKAIRMTREVLLNNLPPHIQSEFSMRRRIEIRPLISLIRKEHSFREMLMQSLGLPKSFKIPAGMDNLLFEGEVNNDSSQDILLQNIYINNKERNDIQEFFKIIGESIVDMTLVTYNEEADKSQH